MKFRDKIGCSTKRDSLEDALTWAVAKDYHYLEFNADREPNHLFSWSDERVKGIRETCDRENVHIGTPCFLPISSDPVPRYLRGPSFR